MTHAQEAPLSSLSEYLLDQFYAWERRGRGWQLYDAPVRPEPAFESFHGHYLPATPPADDGRRQTVFSAAVAGLGSLFTGSTRPCAEAAAAVSPRQPFPEPDPPRSLVELQILLPSNAAPDIVAFEQFLIGSACCRRPLCFEFVGLGEHVHLQLAVDELDADQVEAQLAAYCPEAVLTRVDDLLESVWDGTRTCDETFIAEFGLSREFMLPLQTHKDMRTDPYVGLIAALSGLRAGEIAGIQILFEPVSHPWAGSIVRAVTLPDGDPFFDDAPEFLKQAKAKVARPLFAAVIRIASGSDEEGRTLDIARTLASALGQFSDPAGNELIPLSNDDYDDTDHLDDLLERRSRRSGSILNSEELASLVHLPGEEVRSSRLDRLVKKTKPAPASAQGHALVLGTNTHNGRTVEVSLSPDHRVRHMHVIGASGTGKSTLMLQMIMQDIERGEGIGVIDPHGDLIDQVIGRIPQSRMNDVVLLDCTDEQYPIGFNILSAHSDLEKTLLASDLVAVFRRYATSWGDQMSSVLGNAVLAFLESTRGGTLSDLRRFLIEPVFRNEFLTTVTDSHVVYFWKKEFPLLTGGKSQAPLLTRLDTFLRPKPIRYMVAQQHNRLDIASIMDTGKIFLAKLSQGAIGEENASLLGSLLVSKFHQITLGRQAQQESSRKPFYLYCDEFGGYVTPSMAKLFSGARKYRLGLILAHQELRQLHDEDVRDAVIGNALTRICFRLGDADAKTLSEGFTTFEAEDLRNLATGEAIGRIGRADDDFNLTVPRTADINEDEAQVRRAAIITLSRQKYATPRAEVEAQLNAEHAERQEPAERPKLKQQEQTVATAKPAPTVIEPATQRVKKEKREEEPIQTAPAPVPVPSPTVRKPRNFPPIVAPLGKGGQQHKYLQQLLSQWAQGMGFRATIEMPTPDGAGSIDVVLEKESRRIACEISVTSTVDQEVGNLKKCLAAGFTEVLMICAEAKTLKNLEKAAQEELPSSAYEKVKFVRPEELFASTELLQGGGAGEQTVRGYKVKVRMRQVDEAQAEDRRRAVSQVLVRAMRKKN